MQKNMKNLYLCFGFFRNEKIIIVGVNAFTSAHGVLYSGYTVTHKVGAQILKEECKTEL